jgi:hypothetical protein
MPVPAPATGTPVSLTVTVGGAPHTVIFVTGASNFETLSNLNTALQLAAVHIQASSGNGTTIDLTASQEGSASNFSVSGGGAVGLSGTSSAGLDAMATIDNDPVAGSGRSVSAGGIVYETSGLGLASVTLTDGLAGALSRAAALAGSATGGTVKGATDGIAASVIDFNKRILEWDTKLSMRQTEYTRKFTAMDTLLAQLNSQLSTIASLTTAATSSTG